MRLVRIVKRHPFKSAVALLLFVTLTIDFASGQNPGAAPERAALPPVAAAQAIPKPGPVSDQPYAPQAILPGGIVVPLFPPGSKYLKADKAREAEKYNMSKDVPGRIASIVNIHNPSIEVHLVDRSLNTGSAVILVAGGGHNTLNVGTEAADFVPFFYNYGVNTVILRNRLRKDGYNAKTDAVYDAQQAIRLVRAHAKEWRIDPNRIGIMGFSAGAELAAPAAIAFDTFDKANNDPGDPLAGISSRPDFVGIVYPGPTPFARGASPPIPRNTPPSFIICAGSGDQNHAVWANEYFTAMLKVSVPNIEMHIYANGHHPGSGSTGGLTDRKNTPFGTWHHRYIDWFRDLGFLQAPGVETRAAADLAAYAKKAGGKGKGGDAPKFKITTKRANDTVEVQAEKDQAVFAIKSPFGISQAVIERLDDNWPKSVVLRLHLKGLENFKAANGKGRLEAAVSSQDSKVMVRLWKDGQENAPLDQHSPFWMNIRIVGGDGKPAQAIPLKDGHVEIALPTAFFEANPKSITLNWIDFYRD